MHSSVAIHARGPHVAMSHVLPCRQIALQIDCVCRAATASACWHTASLTDAPQTREGGYDVAVSGHTVVLGWNRQLMPVLRQVRLALPDMQPSGPACVLLSVRPSFVCNTLSVLCCLSHNALLDLSSTLEIELHATSHC
jgi:hypothetical protein